MTWLGKTTSFATFRWVTRSVHSHRSYLFPILIFTHDLPLNFEISPSTQACILHDDQQSPPIFCYKLGYDMVFTCSAFSRATSRSKCTFPMRGIGRSFEGTYRAIGSASPCTGMAVFIMLISTSRYRPSVQGYLATGEAAQRRLSIGNPPCIWWGTTVVVLVVPASLVSSPSLASESRRQATIKIGSHCLNSIE